MTIPENIQHLLDDILRREGGYVNHPADRGGPTKYGITAATLGEWRKLGRPATADEVLQLTEDEARQIYYSRYVVLPRLSVVQDPKLLALLVDTAVHSGPSTAVSFLQRALGVKADGVIGPETRRALDRTPPEEVYRRVLAERLRFIGKIITRNPSQAVFASGWLNRLAEFVEAA
jgi:lysozyme family protein